MPTIYKQLKAAGVPLDSHASDLYAKVTPESVPIVDQRRKRDHATISTFINQIDGCRWYDIPFAFDPYWEARAEKGGTL